MNLFIYRAKRNGGMDLLFYEGMGVLKANMGLKPLESIKVEITNLETTRNAEVFHVLVEPKKVMVAGAMQIIAGKLIAARSLKRKDIM